MYNEQFLTEVKKVKIWQFGHCNTGNKFTNNMEQLGSIDFWIKKEGF